MKTVGLARSGAPIALLLALTATIWLQARISTIKYQNAEPLLECPWCEKQERPADDVLFVPVSAPVMRLLAPADAHFLADALWLRACYYFGEHAITNRQYPYLFHLVDLITDLSPDWKLPYLFAVIILPTEADAVEEGMYFIDKGLAFHPDYWRFWFFKGYYLWEEYDDAEGAGAAFEHAAMLPGAPRYLVNLSATFQTKAGRTDLALRYLKQIVQSLQDERQREMVLKKIQELENESSGTDVR